MTGAYATNLNIIYKKESICYSGALFFANVPANLVESDRFWYTVFAADSFAVEGGDALWVHSHLSDFPC